MDKSEKDILDRLRTTEAGRWAGQDMRLDAKDAANEIESLRAIVAASRSPFGTCDFYGCRNDSVEQNLTTDLEYCQKHNRHD